MKKLIILILIFLYCVATSFAQYKGYTVQATTRLQADNVFFWKGDTIKKDSLVYADIKPDSIRFRRINGAFTKWYKLKFDIYKLKSDSVDLKGYLSNYKGLGKEDKSNKVISISSGSTDIQYPSAKLLFDQLGTKEPTITSGTSLQYWRGDKTWQTLNKSAVGLDNVDNTSDLLKPISNAAQTALNAKENSITKGSTSQYFRGDMSLATMPTSLPASDVYDWAKASTKPTYTYSEVGAASSSHNHDGSYDYYAAWIPAVNGTNGPYGVGSWGSFNFISGSGISLSLSGLSMTISATGGSMTYPGAGIAVSTGSAWGTSITNNSNNWNTAYSWGNHAGLYTPISNNGKVFIQTGSTGYTMSSTYFTNSGSYIVPQTSSNPTSGSSLPITSGSVYNALLTKASLSGAAFTGDVTCSSTFTATDFILQSSDKRLKQNIKLISNLNWVNCIPLVQYTFKSDTAHKVRFGVIAQDVERFAPNLVHTNADGFKSVSYTDIIIAKLAAMEYKISDLELEIKNLRKKQNRHEK